MKLKLKLPKNLDNYYAFLILLVLLGSASILIFFQITKPGL